MATLTDGSAVYVLALQDDDYKQEMTGLWLYRSYVPVVLPVPDWALGGMNDDHAYIAQGMSRASKVQSYPVPSLIGAALIHPECVVLYQPDDCTGNEPYLTYWNESYGLPLPSDHGICNPDTPK